MTAEEEAFGLAAARRRARMDEFQTVPGAVAKLHPPPGAVAGAAGIGCAFLRHRVLRPRDAWLRKRRCST
jgi:hypothetical protein